MGKLTDLFQEHIDKLDEVKQTIIKNLKVIGEYYSLKHNIQVDYYDIIFEEIDDSSARGFYTDGSIQDYYILFMRRSVNPTRNEELGWIRVNDWDMIDNPEEAIEKIKNHDYSGIECDNRLALISLKN